MISLKGSSWNHERGHAPMVATALTFKDLSDDAVSVAWTPRSLQDFGTFSVEQLAREFDLIVIDHPHIGVMAQSGCALALDEWVEPSEMTALGLQSPGRSHQSYQYGGHQWAFAIDAACQTSAWRPDLLLSPPRTWEEVTVLAKQGQVIWPLGPTDAAASFMTLLATLGESCATSQDRFANRDFARRALITMHGVAQVSDRCCLSDNPIDALDALSLTDQFVYSPLLFCYVNYSRVGHKGERVAFGDNPSFDTGAEPRGSLLGGAGLAVSAHCPNPREAVDYALYVASASVQSGVYVASGGQPAHNRAWSSAPLDQKSGGFFSGVRRTIEGSWTRSTDPYFAHFQNKMIEHFVDWYDEALDPDRFLDRLDVLYVDALTDLADTNASSRIDGPRS